MVFRLRSTALQQAVRLLCGSMLGLFPPAAKTDIKATVCHLQDDIGEVIMLSLTCILSLCRA